MTDPLTPALQAALKTWTTKGEATRQRFKDWEAIRTIPRHGERGGGQAGVTPSPERHQERIDDHRASQYRRELDHLTRRLTSDLTRLVELCQTATPPLPKPSADQGCRSCARDGGYYEPVHHGRYRTACRFCGEWRAAEGDWPPLKVVRWRHANPGKRVPLRIVQAATG